MRIIGRWWVPSAWAIVDRKTEKGYNPSKKPVIEGRRVTGYPTAQLNVRNFLDRMKTKAKCNCDVLAGHLSTSAILLANISYKTVELQIQGPL